ncbi:hypothetical protein BUALT_BualtUnG0007700 [Buddleja alternifolia]|uniref:Pectinesterase inhibitor domain-containing protein n=1 Tax=Buddleja alternifolia TaxID=168488 RepID=A0AAV6W7P5_9LAMI|nr:hypothetical protein BUALT_BualtUnG0007700 [Buddleja alternifolia]
MYTTAMSSIMAIAIALTFVVQQSNAVDFHQWCQRTSHNNLCVSVVMADPRNNLKTSPNGICRILTDKAITIANANAARISDLQKKSTGRITGPLRTCSTEYDKMRYDLKGFDFTVLNHENYIPLVANVGGAAGTPGDCEGAFKEFHIPSPLTNANKNLEDILVAVLEIINLNECNKINSCIG